VDIGGPTDRDGGGESGTPTGRPLSADDFRHRPGRPDEPQRTFHPRRASLGRDRAADLARLWPRFGLSVHDEALGRGPRTPGALLDTAALFGRTAPLVLEIGPGMGAATVAMAAADPGRDVLAVEAHLPGIAALLSLVERHGLTNVRVVHGDALELVRDLPPGSFDEVRAYFPDPWPKQRHARRRLARPDTVALLRDRLVVGGLLHLATDAPDYAAQMLAVLTADPGLANVDAADGYTPRPTHRPTTAFERKAAVAGRGSRDLVFRRVR